MSTRKLRRKYRPSSMPVQGKNRIVRRALTHRREIDHGKQWFVVRTNIGGSRRAELGLRACGFDVYRPVEDRWRVYKRRCSDISLDWFGRYLFVGCGECPRFGSLRETDGVESILMIQGNPIAVRPEVLQRIADELSGYRKPAPTAFKRGQKVDIAAGQFVELRGIIEEADVERSKVKVSVEMFGKTHKLELDFVELKAA
jgi:transcription antitermination factor NusG